jgi:hypothetical protein
VAIEHVSEAKVRNIQKVSIGPYELDILVTCKVKTKVVESITQCVPCGGHNRYQKMKIILTTVNGAENNISVIPSK